MSIKPKLSSICGLIMSTNGSTASVQAPNSIELQSVYQISVIVTDKGPLSRTAKADVMISIIEGNYSFINIHSKYVIISYRRITDLDNTQQHSKDQSIRKNYHKGFHRSS